MVVAAKALAFALQYAILRMYTQYSAPAEYGKFTLLVVSVALGSTLLYGPLGNLCSLEYHKEASLERGSAFGVALAVGTLPLSALAILPLVPAKFRLYWVMAVVLLTLSGITNILSGLLNTARRRGAYLLSSNIECVIRAIAILALGRALQTLSGELLGAISVGSACCAFVVTALLWRHRLTISWMGWSRVLLVKTLPFTVLALCGWVLAISDRWMLSFFGSVAETGRYAAFYQACSVTAALSTGFAATIVQPVIFQKIARGESAGHVMTVALNVALVLTAPPLIALAWIPDFFLPIVISHKYGLPSPWLVVGVAVGAFLLGLESVVSMGVVAATSAWRIVRYAVAAATTNVLLNSLFIPRFGAVAAGVSTGIAYGIEAILVLLAARAVCGLRLPLASIVAAIVFAMAGAAAIGLAGFGLHTRVIFASAGVLCWALVSRESLANCVSGLKYFVFSRPSVLT